MTRRGCNRTWSALSSVPLSLSPSLFFFAKLVSVPYSVHAVNGHRIASRVFTRAIVGGIVFGVQLLIGMRRYEKLLYGCKTRYDFA